jgi:hypothetical protein
MHRLAAIVAWLDGGASKVLQFRDYKGTLEVTTAVPLDKAEQDAIRRAWEAVGHEPADQVEFMVDGVQP